ncbi:hypothetical protein E2C01_077706 [Portunus trituberculatus]|uniref:Uncharacterized protein n=1 Tax=Portunus trituberculatus TaxID=210409 RepID=A0A5B7IMR9_PORTR|nr:hypothetical protein [Portunus trituberculatus]
MTPCWGSPPSQRLFSSLPSITGHAAEQRAPDAASLALSSQFYAALSCQIQSSLVTAAPETIWLPERLTARLCVVAAEDKVATETKKEEEKGGGKQGDGKTDTDEGQMRNVTLEFSMQRKARQPEGEGGRGAEGVLDT